ncbi:MAG: TIGR03936 family radical SAM-associated protein [Oscillospiraceae bacterium]
MPSVNTRVFYSKLSRAKYISALDMNNCVIRAIRRTKLPVWQTEGFNPHTYVSFMLPLSLGQEGTHEAMDFRLLEDIPFEEVKERLNAALPPDIRAVEIAVPKYKYQDIASAKYRVESDIDVEKFRAFLQSEHILTEKKTKKGIVTVDLKPLVEEWEASPEALTLRLPAGNEMSINPTLLLDAYKAQTGGEISCLRIVRTNTYIHDGTEFY